MSARTPEHPLAEAESPEVELWADAPHRTNLPEGDTTVRVLPGQRACVIYGDYILALEKGLEVARADVFEAERKAFRYAAEFLTARLKKARVEGHEIPSQLDRCAHELEVLARKQVKHD